MWTVLDKSHTGGPLDSIMYSFCILCENGFGPSTPCLMKADGNIWLLDVGFDILSNE